MERFQLHTAIEYILSALQRPLPSAGWASITQHTLFQGNASHSMAQEFPNIMYNPPPHPHPTTHLLFSFLNIKGCEFLSISH